MMLWLHVWCYGFMCGVAIAGMKLGCICGAVIACVVLWLHLWCCVVVECVMVSFVVCC